MADIFSISNAPKQPPEQAGQSGLNLTPDEKRLFDQLFQLADTNNVGVVTGEVAPKFFERSGLPPIVLGEIWNIADTENRGFLTQFGFGVALRLIGHAQNGASPKQELALRPGPLPRFEGLPAPYSSTQPSLPLSQGPRVPALAPDRINAYTKLFEESGPQDGRLSGDAAKKIFEGAKLPNEVLGKIWSLADRDERGSLDSTEFIIAMHLLVCHKNGLLPNLPPTLPRGLFEAASRSNTSNEYSAGIPPPKQYGGAISGAMAPRFTGLQQPVQPQPSGGDWAITGADKARFDKVFDDLDKQKKGFITGEEAVPFFSKSNLSENVLAQIWDLVDINSEGHLKRDEFAVALYLIWQQRANPGIRLPERLPPNLIPPRLRQQSNQQQYPPPPPSKSSALDDLVGLDAGPAATQIPASTGGSGPFGKSFELDPSKRPLPGSLESSVGQSPVFSGFKPFKPSLSGPLAAMSTGGSAGSVPRNAPSTMGDLLGDADPEISNKLDSEHTTELANLSNQAGNLSKQVQEVKGQRASTEAELQAAVQQKAQFESRLNQMKTLYEQEAKNVQLLQERLATSRKDTISLQQQCASIEQSYQDLQNEQRQVLDALESDQRENRSLNEKIKIVNATITQLRPELEKLRSESRQQKGRVAIGKKQLSTAEADRDKAQEEIEQLKRSGTSEPKSVPSPQPAVTSPALSTASHSTNPFHKKSPQASVDNTQSNTFESVFGPQVTSPLSNAPPTSFRGDVKPDTRTASVRSDGPDFPTPGSSPQVQHDSPRVADPPPPPAPERQITSSFLPFRNPNDRADSFSSSLNVVPSTNASRYGNENNSRAETPTNWITSASGQNPDSSKAPERVENLREGLPRQDSGTSSKAGNIPGAFPNEAQSPILATPTGGSALSDGSKASGRQTDFSARPDPFGLDKPKRNPTAAKEDFDAAFASLGKPKSNEPGSRFDKEFPPIAINEDDESDTNSEHGFDDDFNPAAQSPGSRPATRGKEKADAPPPADAQQSPPKYEGGQGTTKDGKRDPNQFAPEFGGLLPSRADPTEGSPNSVPSGQKFPQPTNSRGAPSTAHTFSSSPPLSADTPLSTAPSDAYQPALAFGSGKGLAAANPPSLSKGLFDDDFEKDFADLSAAKEADKGDDFDITSSRHRESTDEFNPSFDSPSASKSSTLASSITASGKNPGDTFPNFEQPTSASGKSKVPSGPAPTSKEWDDFFADLGPSAPQAAIAEPNGHSESSDPTSSKPILARGISTGTEHDDPILKKLTGMGYGRDEALGALEKYNYNLDKAANFLVQSPK